MMTNTLNPKLEIRNGNSKPDIRYSQSERWKRKFRIQRPNCGTLPRKHDFGDCRVESWQTRLKKPRGGRLLGGFLAGSRKHVLSLRKATFEVAARSGVRHLANLGGCRARSMKRIDAESVPLVGSTPRRRSDRIDTPGRLASPNAPGRTHPFFVRRARPSQPIEFPVADRLRHPFRVRFGPTRSLKYLSFPDLIGQIRFRLDERWGTCDDRRYDHRSTPARPRFPDCEEIEL